MSDSTYGSASTGTGEGWPRPSLNSSAPPPPRRDSKNSSYNGTSIQSSPRAMMSKPSLLQDDGSRRTSLSGTNSPIPSYVSSPRNGSRLQSLSQQSRPDGQLGLYRYRRQGSISYAQSLTSSRATGRGPIASPDNDFLGFCKGAWKLQNGDRKGAMEKCKEAQSWSRNASRSTTLAQHLQCSQNKCAFRSNYISNDGDLIYDKVIDFPEKGIKLRWTFLAKSHVPQKVVIRNQYAFKCVFCVYSGLGPRAGVYVGTEYYLDHIDADHRGQAMNEILLYKTSCVNERIADNDEEFDINLWPLDATKDEQTQQWLSDSLLGDPAHMPRLPPNDSLGANEPWILDAFEDFDTTMDNDSDDGKATVTTAIHHPPAARSDISRRESVQSEVSTPATVLPADFPAPPEKRSPQRSPGKFTYEEWEDNPEAIWGSNRTSPNENPDQPPMIPLRSHARLASIRESRDAPQVLQQAPQSQYIHGLPTPMSSMDLGTAPNQMGLAGEEELGITTCLKTIINAFNDAAVVVEEIKKQPIPAQMQILPLLEDSILEAPEEINREWQRGVTRFNEAFEKGDYIAIIALQQITIALHNKLVDALRVVALGKPSDFAQLMDVADSGRYHVISTLHELRKRLMQSPPSFANAPNTFTAERTMSPEPQHRVGDSRRAASHPNAQTPQHLSHMRPDLWKDPYFPNRDAAAPPKEARHTRAQSDATSDATRRPSVLNSFSKSKWGRKISSAKSPGQSKEDVNLDQVVDGVKVGLRLDDVVELDATPVVK